MVRAPDSGAPQVAVVRAPAGLPTAAASGIVPVSAPVAVPAALPSSGSIADPSRVNRIKPSALVPGNARAPVEKAPEKPAADRASTGKLAPGAPTAPRSTELAARPMPPAPVPAAAPAAGKASAQPQQPYQPKPTDSLGLLVARLGANR
ncbi:hypothetical protein [Azospirillum thiophilum]|uniref:hypothetical protein n=1 Tax=Azospirillum thiophilum TaxID=528244 RepID=UPI000AC5D0FB|nr:hypothetical protein [Azospirillum thiophilum]